MSAGAFEPAPILDREACAAWAEAARARGARVVFTNGAFDLLHAGHLGCLEAARAEGNVLLVGVNADASVRASKGASRPVVPEAERARLVAALRCVDAVTVFSETTVDALLETVRPAVHAKGPDYDLASMPERETAERLGIEMAFVGPPKQHATTSRLDTIRASGDGVRASWREPDTTRALDVDDGHGFVLRRAKPLLAAEGWLDPERFVATEEGAIVEEQGTRWVRRIEVGGRALFVKVTSPFERKRSALVEYHNHLALRSAGFLAPAPWLAYEGRIERGPVGVLVTEELPGADLDAFLHARLAGASPEERSAWARGIGQAVRALHTARFLQPDLQAWHVKVVGSPAEGQAGLAFLDLMRVTRAGRKLRMKDAVDGLAALALSLESVSDDAFRRRALRAYLGGSLRMAQPWLKLLEGRMAHLRTRSRFRTPRFGA